MMLVWILKSLLIIIFLYYNYLPRILKPQTVSHLVCERLVQPYLGHPH